MQPLAGQKLMLTRSRDDCASWAERLASMGIEPIIYPCIHTELIETPALGSNLRNAFGAADWLIFTSRRGVETTARHNTLPIPANTRVAVVGKATAAKAMELIGRVDIIGRGTGVALAYEMTANPSFKKDCRCVIAVAENAAAELEDILRRAGANCERFDVYRTLPSDPREPKALLSAINPDAIVFASPTAVVGFTNQVAMDVDRPAFTIGPTTSAAMRARGLDVEGEAREPSLNGILETIVESTHA